MRAEKMLQRIERRIELEMRRAAIRDLVLVRMADKVFPPTTEKDVIRVFLPNKPDEPIVRLLKAVIESGRKPKAKKRRKRKQP